MGMQPQSTYEQADEVRKQLNLDHSQFEKVYSAYEKYNNAVFGNQSNGMMMPPPAGGHPDGSMGNRPGNGGRPGKVQVLEEDILAAIQEVDTSISKDNVRVALVMTIPTE